MLRNTSAAIRSKLSAFAQDPLGGALDDLRFDVGSGNPANAPAPRPFAATHNASATFGITESTDYRATFFEANPELEGQVVVHHAVEQQVMTCYPGVVSEAEMHSLENLRGIPKEINPDLHLSQIRRAWNQFYRENAAATQQQLLQKASEIDTQFGSQFQPPR